MQRKQEEHERQNSWKPVETTNVTKCRGSQKTLGKIGYIPVSKTFPQEKSNTNTMLERFMKTLAK